MRRQVLHVAAVVLLGGLVLGGAALAQTGPGADRAPAAQGRDPGGPGERMGPPPGPGGPGGPDGPGGRFGPPPGMGGPGGGLMLPPPEAFERLGLTDAQRTKLESLRDVERRKAIRTDAEVRLAEMDLVKLVESDKPEATAIDDAIAHLMAMRAEQLKARAEAIIAMRAVLTPEQRHKMRRPDPDARWH